MTRNDYLRVFHVYWPIGLGVGVAVWVVALAVLWRRRAARVGDDWPTGRAKNMPLELSWVALLAATVAFLLYITYSTMGDYERADAAPASEHVQVSAAQWNWRFTYPRYGIVSQGKGAGRVVPTLTVPVDTPIRFTGTSQDVIHSFLIAHERFQRQVFPGRTVHWTMSFGRGWLGRHGAGGECVQFCGLFHSYMRFNVDVLTQQAFRRWVSAHRGKGTA